MAVLASNVESHPGSVGAVHVAVDEGRFHTLVEVCPIVCAQESAALSKIVRRS